MTYTITPLIGEEAIRARVKELAASIDAAMAGRPYILLLLLNGALPFATMLKGPARGENRQNHQLRRNGTFRLRGMGWGLRAVPA